VTNAEKNRLFRSLDLADVMEGTSVGSDWYASTRDHLEVRSPAGGGRLASIEQTGTGDFKRLMRQAQKAFPVWRGIPAPKRGDIVRQIGNALREKKDDLGRLVSLEMGKILSEGQGEVQEMIDICDFAVGLGRTLSGPTLQSERPMHRMMEQWHPLGTIGVISAFNFPVAVWSWNASLAWVCGDTVVWKPSSKAPLCAIACQNIVSQVFRTNGIPDGVSAVAIGSGGTVGELLINDKRIALVSATGSTPMGKRVAEVVGRRLGRTILELGGNNALIVSDKADLNLALSSAFFGAVGTAGQRCTSTRRLIIQETIYSRFIRRLVAMYKQVRIGDPMKPGTLMGPLIDESAVEGYTKAVQQAQDEGGRVLYGGKVLRARFGRRTFVEPAIIEISPRASIVQAETFAPILYVMSYREFKQALAIHNSVPQGLSSGVFTDSVAEAEEYLSFRGSDCGIANVNLGTSGAEIGGAFGGEKDTGGGRESGSDAWKAYMRRQTNTINWGGEVHLAQGVEFGE
jgi:aldehyde dehydrogenase (NAD+)